MTKLFAMLSDEQTAPNDLLIDKILKNREQNREGLSLTSELLQQRHELKQEITEGLNKPPADDDGGDQGDQAADDKKADDAPPAEDKEATGGEDNSEKKTEDKETDGVGDEGEDPVDAAQSVEALEASIGGGNSKDKGKAKEDDKVATESFKAVPITLATLFSGVKKNHVAYQNRLRMFSLESDAVSVTQQPVVYVKDEVVKSLNKLISIAQESVTKNAQLVQTSKEAAKNIGDRLAVYHACIGQELFSFTNEVVTDTDLIASFSVEGKSEPYETAKVLAEFLDVSAVLAMMIAKTDIVSMQDAFTANGFTVEGQDITYGKQLPGFYKVMAGLTTYPNYIDVKYQDFQVFRVRTLKPREVQSLDGVSVTKDNDRDRLLGACDKILVSLGLSVDALNTVNDTYLGFIDKIKSVIYDVENKTMTDLSSIGLDEHMKEFIRFRLMTDVYSLSIGLSSEFLSAILSLLSKVSTLREPKA